MGRLAILSSPFQYGSWIELVKYNRCVYDRWQYVPKGKHYHVTKMMLHTSLPQSNILIVKFGTWVHLPSIIPNLALITSPWGILMLKRRQLTCDLKDTYLWASSETLRPWSWWPASGGAHCHSCCSAPEAGEPERSRGEYFRQGQLSTKWYSRTWAHSCFQSSSLKYRGQRCLVSSPTSWCQLVKDVDTHPLSLSRNYTQASVSPHALR